ncbi:MAG: dUTP diphosphatase [Bacillota bacterium]
MRIAAVRVSKEFPLAFKKYPADAGHDLYATKTMILWPFMPVKIPLNIRVSTPPGVFGRVCGRSSVSARGICVMPGTVDSGYVGQLFAVAVNVTLLPRRIRAGDRVAQLIFIPFCPAEIEEADALSPTARGDRGLGSTGRR